MRFLFLCLGVALLGGSPHPPWNEEWNGTEQRRHFKIEGDKLILTTSPAPSPIYPGKTYYAKVVFEREK